MAPLTSQQQTDLLHESMRDERLGLINQLLKTDLGATLIALDGFVDANAAAINAVIPQPARARLTTQQKALLLMFVVAKRYVVG